MAPARPKGFRAEGVGVMTARLYVLSDYRLPRRPKFRRLRERLKEKGILHEAASTGVLRSLSRYEESLPRDGSEPVPSKP
jgi:hypothetical protein